MLTIWKYELSPRKLDIEMPVGATALVAKAQHGKLCVWALVDPEAPKETRHFEVYGTGHWVPPGSRTYLGSALIDGGAVVFHVFETIKPWSGGEV